MNYIYDNVIKRCCETTKNNSETIFKKMKKVVDKLKRL